MLNEHNRPSFTYLCFLIFFLFKEFLGEQDGDIAKSLVGRCLSIPLISIPVPVPMAEGQQSSQRDTAHLTWDEGEGGGNGGISRQCRVP